MIDFNNIILTDHCGYITDINLENYFQMDGNQVNNPNRSRINSRKLLHRTKFEEKVNEMIDLIGLELLMDQYYDLYTSGELLEMFDNKYHMCLTKQEILLKAHRELSHFQK